MTGRFLTNADVVRDVLDWGSLGWVSRPAATGAKALTVLDVDLTPGFGHNFHRHPDQEEVIFVVDGEIEQWLEREMRVLRKGDAVFIGKNVVHASFNVSGRPARVLAILGPAVTEAGYVAVEVGNEEPWRTLR
ncbi:MAG: cupin domain-containing protein [Acidobacteria bacterium]|nr:cupin domain-containing protein [Acidobacteriota bacterium]